jgi:hypothetical protein
LSQFLSQSVPQTLLIGQQFNVVIRWLNKGTSSWDPSAGFKVTSQYPTNNTIWGINRVLPVGIVGPEGLLEARFTLTAPSTPGAYDFQWQLHQDGLGIFGAESPGLTIFVYPSLPPTIDGPTRLQPFVGLPFSHQFTTTGGSAPFNWSIANGTMPAGLSLNQSTGLLAGTATNIGVSTLTLQAADANSQTAQKQITIEVLQQQFGITTTALPGGVVGNSYTATLSANGGVPPYTWSITSGSLPSGLSLEATSGTIQGTPTSAGSSIVGITARDQMSRTVTTSLEIVVRQPEITPSITTAKYKSGKEKLIVTVERADPQATLMVNGSQVSARLSIDRFVAKKLSLAPGLHTITVVNPGGTASAPFTLNVR